MENFIVSARKYRPDRFDKVVGQQNITNTLKNAIRNNHLAQAFLFSGPRGVGKTTVARLLAKTLNCTNITEDTEPCNECESCKTFNESASFNVHELDAASNNSVEDIRSLVEQVRVPPQAGNYKVYIIDEVHMLSTAAFNAFLKTLEEPPPYAKFILATTEKHKIIPTILSRCQSYDFHRIPVDQIKEQLVTVAQNEDINAEPEALQMIAQKADGALRDALSIFDQVVNYAGGNITYEHVIENLNILDYDYYFRLTDFFLNADIHNSLLLYEEITIKGFAGQQFASGLGNHLRNLLVCRDENTVKLLEVGAEIRKKYLEYSNKFSTNTLLSMLDIVNKTDLNYRNANNKRLQIELGLMQICSLANASETEKKTSGINKQSENVSLKPTNPKSNETKSTQPANTETQATEQNNKAHEAQNKTQQTENQETNTVKLNKNKRKLTTVSLKEEIPEETETKNAEDTEETPSGPVTKVDYDDLKKAIQAYITQEKEQKPSFVTDLENSSPELIDDVTIQFKLTNKLYTGQDYILDLQRFLRNKLNNAFIKIEVDLQINKAENKVFTSKEKYERITQINADFENFKQTLDLDYE
ncbi:MAG: DNA polymerase III subunit gamma/tau [Bacteroidales bacterium]|nr:DNA polymerase III subunit gamma/tau [Bacteroidales bacterium]MCF8326790.1 DNA polymerase III subunit gamma/tau [Bacteroidales bacterium]